MNLVYIVIFVVYNTTLLLHFFMVNETLLIIQK